MKTVKRFFRKVKRVIDFLPIIWKGYDFDYHYAIELFRYQLERMANFFESNGAYSVESKANAQRIRTVLKLMDKVYDEEYAMEHVDLIQALYGEEKFESVSLDREDCKGCYTYRLTHANAVDEQHQKEILQVRQQMAKLSYQKQKRAHKLLWQMIEHRIQWWWD
jgi:hypothetical protein